MKNRHLPRWLALLLALALVAAACGGSDEDSEESTDQTVAAESFDDQAAEEQDRTGDDEVVVEEPEEAELQTGGTLVISGPSDIASLDPITSSSFNAPSMRYLIVNVMTSVYTLKQLAAIQERIGI